MEQLAHELSRLAWRLQRDAEYLRAWVEDQNESAESTQATQAVLERIDRRLAAVHGQTSELVSRVPKDLSQTMTELKETILARLAEMNEPTQSDGATASASLYSPNEANHSQQSPGAAMRLLTPQERRVFQLCFQSGLVTYEEIANHLDITASAAKNLVNRIFQSDRKRSLFSKEYRHGAARVGIGSGLEKRILAGGVVVARAPRVSGHPDLHC